MACGIPTGFKDRFLATGNGAETNGAAAVALEADSWAEPWERFKRDLHPPAARMTIKLKMERLSRRMAAEPYHSRPRGNQATLRCMRPKSC
jgi:hypothetical protein